MPGSGQRRQGSGGIVIANKIQQLAGGAGSKAENGKLRAEKRKTEFRVEGKTRREWEGHGLSWPGLREPAGVV